MRIISNHPNAIIGGLLGAGGVGQAAIWLLNAEGVHLSQRQSGLVVAGTATAVLAAGRAIKYAYRNGIVGVWRVVLHGKAGPDAAASATEAGPVDDTVHGPAGQIILLRKEVDDGHTRIAQLEQALAQREQQLAAAGLPMPPIVAAAG